MQGKLSERLPEDDNVYDLYDAIMKKKATLIKNRVIKKDKKFDDITKNEIQYNIPKEWQWIRFGKIITLQSGQDLKPEEYNDQAEGVPYITGASNFNNDGTLKINRWTLCPRAYAKENDILFSCKGTVGKTAILHQEKVHIARQIMGVRTYCVDINFICYFLEFATEGIKTVSKGLIPGIERNDILNLCCPLPSLAEQRRIVTQIRNIFSVLDRIDNLQIQYSSNFEIVIRKLTDASVEGKLTKQFPKDGIAEDLYTKILAEKAGLMQQGKIKKEKALPEISGNEIPFDIPSNWKWVRLGAISWFQGGYAFKSNLYVEDSDNQVIRLGNVKQNALLLDARPAFISDELAKEVEDYRIRENDILITMTGTRRKKDYFYAKCVEQSDLRGKKLYLNQRVGCIRVVDGVYPQFLVIALQNTEIRKIIFERETGAVNQGNLGSEDIKKFVYIPLPPYAEQIRIVEKIREVISCGQIMHLK